MGDHDTWYTLLPFWHDLELAAEDVLRRDWRMTPFEDTHFTLLHVGAAVVAALFLIIAAFRYRATIKDPTQGVVPTRRFTLGAMVDGFVGAVYQLAVDVLGEEDAKRYLPIFGTLALFVFCCNIQALIPGFAPPTDTLKTNLALALLVFLLYLFVGITRNPKHFLGEFLGPKIGGFYMLAWLFIPLELASHIARPVSLSLRLMGNILVDHKVVITIASLIALLVPVPFLLLGVLVAIIQTLIFTLLSIIYVGLALSHADH